MLISLLLDGNHQLRQDVSWIFRTQSDSPRLYFHRCRLQFHLQPTCDAFATHLDERAKQELAVCDEKLNAPLLHYPVIGNPLMPSSSSQLVSGAADLSAGGFAMDFVYDDTVTMSYWLLHKINDYAHFDRHPLWITNDDSAWCIAVHSLDVQHLRERQAAQAACHDTSKQIRYVSRADEP